MTGQPEILADLSARLRAYERDRGPAVLLDQTAQARAVAVSDAILAGAGNRSDPDALRVLGEWFLVRYLALPAGSGQADLRYARLHAGLLRDLGDGTLIDRLADLDSVAGVAARASETAFALLEDFDVTGDQRRVVAARAVISTLADLLEPDHPLHGELIFVGGQFASTMFTIHGDPARLDEAVRVGRLAVADASPDDPRTIDKTVFLVIALLSRHESRSTLDDLNEAQALVERLTAAPDPPPNVVIALSAVLHSRFLRTRRISELDRAIVACRETIGAIPDAHPSVTQLRRNLMFCLISRLEHVGQDADLAEAIEIARAMLVELGPGPNRRDVLTALSLLLTWRSARGSRPADLVEATRWSREAVALSARFRGMRGRVLLNHATILWARLLAGDDRQELPEAIEVCRQAVAAHPRGVLGALARSMLSRLLTIRSTVDGQLASLDEALAEGRAAVAGFSPGHPLRTIALLDLAGVYQHRHQLTGDRADLDGAVGLWRSAVWSPTGKPPVRLQAARTWLGTLLRHRELAAAAEPAKAQVDLLPVVAWRGLDRAGRERRLAGLGDAATLAAALAIELGRPEQAVELVEQGRSVLWAQAIQTRSDLSALHAAAPRLAAELDQTRVALDQLGFTVDMAETVRDATRGTSAATDRTAHAYRTLVERWETLLADARAVPGFADFLGATPFATLRTAVAADGAVVIVNVAGPRCDALIVRRTGVRSVPLPWLTLGDAYRRAAGLLASITEADGALSGPGRTHLRQTLGSMVRWLWDAVAEPVLAALDADDPDRASPHRVWWCPTGPLTLLPLHAAGRYGAVRRHRGAPPTVPDRTRSSYTTSLGALLRASRPPAGSGPATLLAVGMPHTEGRAALPEVARELRQIAASIPGALSLVGAAATPDALLAQIGRHRWAHFACHATQHVGEPSRSALHLAGGDLSVRQLATLDLADAELAYLSACRTAGGSLDLADEAINLAAALQLAGYRNVIGTLWSVADRDAAAVAETVYRVVATQPVPDFAAALATATADLRARHPGRPDLWAPFVHLGR